MFDYFIDNFRSFNFLFTWGCRFSSLDAGENKQPDSNVKNVSKARFLFFDCRGQQTVPSCPFVNKPWTKNNFHISKCFKTGIPNLQNLMPDFFFMPDVLSWSWCNNNNRNRVHNKCNALESSWNHIPPPPPRCVEKFHKTGPWHQKGWGPLC